MIKTKIATIGLSLALVLGVSAPAGAVTVAELQAQINALMAQLATLQGGTTTTGTYNFTQNLTVGSTGGDVTSLQMFLVGGGYLNMPTGVSYGYFGTLTQAAVAKWQAANGISPAAGYFGPISRAKANAMSAGTTTGGTTTGGTTTTGGSITTPGVEGTLAVRLASTPTSVKLYEGDSKKAVMGIELEADLSDIKIERVKVKLDENDTSSTSDRDFYRKIADKLYIMDGSTVLGSVDLNADTVVEESSGNFYVTVTGLNFVVAKDTKKVLTVALDAMSTWDTAFDGDSWTVSVPVDGVRGLDGAGINQYSPATLFSRNFTTQNELIASATLKIAKNTDSPKAGVVVASEGADENEKDGVELLRFDLKAEKDAVTVTELKATITHGATGGATTTTIYLMDGTTVLDSVSASTLAPTSAEITFDDDFTIAAGATKVLKIVADFVDANGTAKTYSATVLASQVTAENSAGDGITESGSATGETISVISSGPQFSLVSKAISKSSTPLQNNVSTSTVQADFVIRVTAVGGDVILGTTATSTTTGYPFVSNAGGGHDDEPSFAIYKDGAEQALVVASSTNVTVPSGYTVTSNSFTVTEGSSVDVTVSYTFNGRTTAGVLLDLGSYAVGIEQLNWVSTGGAGESEWMEGDTGWRTSTVTLP